MVKWVVLPLTALTALFSALVVVALLVAGLVAERLLRRVTRGRREGGTTPSDGADGAGADR